MPSEAEEILREVARKAALAAGERLDSAEPIWAEDMEQIITGKMRESGLLRLLEALGQWEREEFAPVKDPLLVHQRRKELSAAWAAIRSGK